MAILANRRLSLRVDSTSSDALGRLAFCKITINNLQIVLASIYVPCGEEAGFLPEVSDLLLEACDGCHLLAGGDYNAVIDPLMDKSSTFASHYTPATTTRLKAFMSDLNLIDLWRLQNPSARRYTFYSNRHQSHSRIDYILLSASLITMTASIDFHPILISDHAPVQCTITPTSHKGRASRWRFNTSLLTNQGFISGIKDSLNHFIDNNRTHSGDPQTLWEAAKCVLRGDCISFASDLAKKHRDHFGKLELEISVLEAAQAQQPTSEQAARLAALRGEYHGLVLTRAEFIVHRTRQTYYLDAERPGRLLALRLKECESKASICAIKNPSGMLQTNPEDINAVFRDFYSDLYKSEVQHDSELCQTFLDSLQLPQITEEQKLILDSPLTLGEIHRALLALNRGKAPGPDGFPPELYMELWEVVGPLLLSSYEEAIAKGEFHRDQRTALITLLLKKGKDPLECSSYRPISLINCDPKIYAKVLALRLETVIDALIHPDQTGFMRGRMAADNVRRLLHVIDAVDDSHGPCGIFSLDAAKAFDHIEWD